MRCEKSRFEFFENSVKLAVKYEIPKVLQVETGLVDPTESSVSIVQYFTVRQFVQVLVTPLNRNLPGEELKLTVPVTPSILNKSVLLFTQYFLKLSWGGLTEIENSFNLKITVNVAKTSHNMGLF